MGAFKRAAIAAQESGKRSVNWGALELDKEHLIPECLHDKDKPQMRAYLEQDSALACEVAS